MRKLAFWSTWGNYFSIPVLCAASIRWPGISNLLPFQGINWHLGQVEPWRFYLVSREIHVRPEYDSNTDTSNCRQMCYHWTNASQADGFYCLPMTFCSKSKFETWILWTQIYWVCSCLMKVIGTCSWFQVFFMIYWAKLVNDCYSELINCIFHIIKVKQTK